MSGFVERAFSMAWKGCMGAGLLATAAAFALYYYQENILYMPNPSPQMSKLTTGNQKGYRKPSEYSKSGRYMGGKEGGADAIPYEDTYVRTPDGQTIHMWLMYHPRKQGEKPLPTLIYFHGNAGNLGYRLPNAAKMYGDIGINILMMDYRGYGMSSGTPTEKGIIMDAESVLDFALAHPLLQNSPIILFGRSLGGAVALSLYQRRPKDIQSLILENTFMSINDMVDALMPFLNYVRLLKNALLMLDWNNGRIIPDVTAPILFVAGALDEIVPPVQMVKLHDLAVKSKKREFYRILGGHHNDCYETPGYYEKFRDHLLSIGIFETVIPVESAATAGTSTCTTETLSGTADPEQPQMSPVGCIESSDDDFDKITHEEVEAAAEQIALPSINTKYRGLHL